MAITFSSLLTWAAVASAGSVLPRVVTELNQAATAEAHPRDNTATRAFSDVQIKTSDGQCLFVDKLSGDFRANLTPIQVAACGSTDGQGWDVITKGAHVSGNNVMLIVSTLTQACFNFDPRRAAGNQVLLFSCGGRADGGGAITDSQEFAFDGSVGPLSFQPKNAAGSCLVVKGKALDVATCNKGDATQSFTFGGAAAGTGNNGNVRVSATQKSAIASTTFASAVASSSASVASAVSSSIASSASAASSFSSASVASAASSSFSSAASSADTATAVSSAASVSTTAAASASAAAGSILTANPTTPVPVSRAGGTLVPTAAAESNQRDATATRAFESVEIRAPNGQCLFIDPTAGDFRQNLIPVSLVDCSGSPNEKWDVITAGKHNNGKIAAALVVSSLTQGCISQDSRRAAGDTVTLFSCGGRADGTGETQGAQLFPFIGQLSFAFAPSNENGKLCILPGNGRLDSGPCPTDGSQLFSIFP
ncbi:hypothetical protein B0T19DRAFT_419950 [Cercophora scortea]|uniref:Ricin B lectin domain-containing protein n=1 Tax=Cercophora scortea TaxID=314031 RepID=A0AAE0IZE5_9PEZI|nr:hypothetical protein B0T19DRAFT_419950 [Cercophora scortea]